MRVMVKDDIDFAIGLTDHEGWAYTRPEFERILRLPHVGSFVWDDECPLGFVTSVQYGDSAVIGHLVVSGEVRGRKVGRRLLEASLRELDEAGMRSVFLYATRAGEPLYESCGFRAVRDVVSCGFRVNHGEKRRVCGTMSSEDLPEVCELDGGLFGDDRSELLKELYREHPDLCFKLVGDGRITGYVFGRRTPLGGDIGPWCSTTGSIDDAIGLIYSVLDHFRGERVDLGFFDDVPLARSALEDLEPVKQVSAKLMVRGDVRYPKDRDGVLGLIGFELG
jgi:GNAT superfamily N-acetyltransferase